MDSLLRYAYVEQPCNACGGSYRVTLQDILMEQRLKHEWQSPRRCAHCSSEELPLMSVFPEDLLQRLGEAWEQVARIAEDAEIDLRVGNTPGNR